MISKMSKSGPIFYFILSFTKRFFLYNLLAMNWLEMSKNSNRRSNTPI